MSQKITVQVMSKESLIGMNPENEQQLYNYLVKNFGCFSSVFLFYSLKLEDFDSFPQHLSASLNITANFL